jgi:hypothetical protein
MSPTPPPSSNTDTVLGGVFVVIFLLFAVGLIVSIWGMIFSQAGYSFWFGLLMLVPLVNLIWVLVFVVSRWPVTRELEEYRQRFGPLTGGVPVAVPAGQQPIAPPPLR